MDEQTVIRLAKERYQTDDVDFDDAPKVAEVHDGERITGAWVSAWVWVRNENEEEAG